MVGRPATLKAPQRSWQMSLAECRNLFGIAAPLAQRGKKTTPKTGFAGAPARQVVGLAFLRLVGAWELYLEEVFLRYMVGVPTSAGAPVVQPASKVARIEDAFSALAAAENFIGTRYTTYLDWTNWKKIKKRAETNFVTGDPFRATLRGPAKRLIERAHQVRHRVAHPSIKARATFNRIAVDFGAGNSQGKLPKGFMVGDLLLLAPPKKEFPLTYSSQPSIFMAYAQLFEDLGNDIAP
jgi:hypothetical protein